jgi:plastocyanin
MRHKLMFVAVALVVLLGAQAAVAVQNKTVAVAITKVGFVPKQVSIQTGDAVKWTNNDTVNHQVVSQAAGLASPILKPDDTFTFTFEKAGRFTVVDALDSKFPKGTVVVAQTPTGVTLSASPLAVSYGANTTASGKLASGEAGAKVEVSTQACGERSAKHLASVTTDSAGAFSLSERPARNTVFTAAFKGATSNAVTVKVRPRLSLAKVARRKFRVRLSAADSFVGHAVVFQRFSAASARWVTVRTVILRTAIPSSLPLPGTMVSSTTFKLKIKSRLRVRAVLPPGQAGACYLAAASSTIRS